jgi:hypothetical protein
MGLAYLVASNDALKIFDYFTSSVTVFGSLTWISILGSHVGFMRGMKAQGLSRDTLPYTTENVADKLAIPALLDLLCASLYMPLDLLQGIRCCYEPIRLQELYHPLHRYPNLHLWLHRVQAYVLLFIPLLHMTDGQSSEGPRWSSLTRWTCLLDRENSLISRVKRRMRVTLE